MSSLTGFSPNNPRRYLGPNIGVPVIVTVSREPTSADIKQPTTGKYYSFGTFWIVGQNPTTGAYGDLWYLAYIQNNLAQWDKVSASNLFSINVIYQSTAGDYTYEPNDAMQQCVVELIGAGGGGGGAQSTGINQSAGSGGGSGGYSVGVFTSDQIGASQSYTVGLGGTGGSSSGGNGNPGGSSTFGSFLSSSGGSGGLGSSNDSTGNILTGGNGGAASGSSLSFGSSGWQGGNAFWMNTVAGVICQSGQGANSIYGNGGSSETTNTNFGAVGNNGSQGGGGSGAYSSGAPRTVAGGAGGDGLIIITEYIFG